MSNTPKVTPSPSGLPEDNVYIVVGRLLEATKAASEGIKGISEEIHHQAETVLTTVKALESLENQVEQLEFIVRGNGNDEALTKQLSQIKEYCQNMATAIKSLEETKRFLRQRVESLDQTHAHYLGAKNAIWWLLGVLAWLMTTCISLYSAFRKG